MHVSALSGPGPNLKGFQRIGDAFRVVSKEGRIEKYCYSQEHCQSKRSQHHQAGWATKALNVLSQSLTKTGRILQTVSLFVASSSQPQIEASDHQGNQQYRDVNY